MHTSSPDKPNEDEEIFLRKGEILGHLEPFSIEINEIVKEDWLKEEEIKGGK